MVFFFSILLFFYLYMNEFLCENTCCYWQQLKCSMPVFGGSLDLQSIVLYITTIIS